LRVEVRQLNHREAQPKTWTGPATVFIKIQIGMIRRSRTRPDGGGRIRETETKIQTAASRQTKDSDTPFTIAREYLIAGLIVGIDSRRRQRSLISGHRTIGRYGRDSVVELGALVKRMAYIFASHRRHLRSPELPAIDIGVAPRYAQ